jgi:signal transduction histidine kinase
MKRFAPATLQARLVLSHLLVALAAILLMAIVAGLLAFQPLRYQVEQRYRALALVASGSLEAPLAQYLAGQITQDDIAIYISEILPAGEVLGFNIYLPDGQPVLQSAGEHPTNLNTATAPDFAAALNSGSQSGGDFITSYRQDGTQYISARIENGNQLLGIFRLEVGALVFSEAAQRTLGMILIAALISAVLAGLIGYWLARRVEEPIETLVQSAENISQGELRTRPIVPSDPLELQRLVSAFNHMTRRMQGNIEEMRSFVAYASHELRTPLTSIKLRVEALRNGALDDPPVTDRFLSEIESEVDRLSLMVNDLLDLSKIEAGLDYAQLAPVNLSMLVSEVCETYRVRAQRAGINLMCTSEPTLPMMYGVEEQLRRMIYNLVDNAIKYTPQDGTVQLITRRVQTGDKIQLLVQDTGFGIAKEHLPHIFDRFYRVEATRPRYGSAQGSGLGLAIARTIAENHLGRIWVTSQLGKGSTFAVEFPVINEFPQLKRG